MQIYELEEHKLETWRGRCCVYVLVFLLGILSEILQLFFMSTVVKCHEIIFSFFATQRFTFKQHSNLWSTYHPMQGLCVVKSVNLLTDVTVPPATCFCVYLFFWSAAYSMQCTPSSKTKFTACLSSTQSRGTHFIFSHTRGSSSSSSSL